MLRGDGLPAFRADVGLTGQRRVRMHNGRREAWISTSIDDLGDLRTSTALFDVDATGLTIAPAIDGVAAGAEIKLPDWTRDNPASVLVQTGSPGSLMLLRPLADGRYKVERVLPGAWRMDQP